MKNGREHPEGYHLDLAFADPADPEAAAQFSRDFVPCIADPKVKSDYTWREGIDLMRVFMKPIPQSTNPYDPNSSLLVVDEYGTPAPDKPRFIVDHSCRHFIHEANNYKSKEPIKGQNVPEWGVKMQDHAMDAVRYALVYIFKMGATSSLSDIYGEGQWRPVSDTPAHALGELTLETSVAGIEGSGFGSLGGTEF
jgi:hypothetical protein